ncbi:MAG: IS3 family transposase, partial [Armatimonadetes bacterium]|nr:IS3 family transposase [Armatimonadota bacterium]
PQASQKIWLTLTRKRYHLQLLPRLRVFTLGISSSAYHRWRKRPVGQREQQLAAHICELFQESDGRYGSPRIHQDLHALGVKCSPKHVARRMKEQHLVARKPRLFVVTTDSKHAFPVAQNLLSREW